MNRIRFLAPLFAIAFLSPNVLADAPPSADAAVHYGYVIPDTGDNGRIYLNALGVWDPDAHVWKKLEGPGGVLPVQLTVCQAGTTINTPIPTTAGGTGVLPSAAAGQQSVCITNYSTDGTQVWCQWDGTAPAVGTGWPIPAGPTGFCQNTAVVPKCIGDGGTAAVAATPCGVSS